MFTVWSTCISGSIGAVIILCFIVIWPMVSVMVWLIINNHVHLERFDSLSFEVIDSDPGVLSLVTSFMITPFIFRGAMFAVIVLNSFEAFVPLCSVCGVIAREVFEGIILHQMIDTLLESYCFWKIFSLAYFLDETTPVAGIVAWYLVWLAVSQEVWVSVFLIMVFL